MAAALVSVLRPWLLRLAAMRRETLHGLRRDLEAPIRRRRASCAFGGANGPRSGQSAGSAAREPIRPQSPTPNENRHPRRLTSRRSKGEDAPSTPLWTRYLRPLWIPHEGLQRTGYNCSRLRRSTWCAIAPTCKRRKHAHARSVQERFQRSLRVSELQPVTSAPISPVCPRGLTLTEPPVKSRRQIP